MLEPAGLYGLPAPPFWATCSASRCALITPGELPENSPAPSPAPSPGPSPSPQCPRPALPTSGACTFTNSSQFKGGAAVKQINVDLNNYEACCGKHIQSSSNVMVLVSCVGLLL